MRRQIAPFILILACIMCGCHNDDISRALESKMQSLYSENRAIADSAQQKYSVKCHNGVFVGKDSANILSFKGIPYALPPTGKRRWKAPEDAPESNKAREAYYYGYSPIQTRIASDAGSYYPQSEDCLTLNIWTVDTTNLSECKRPVMVWIHGGAYGWGSTAGPIYDGHNFVAAHPEVVLVTVGYRLGILGFIDLSSVEGGEEYKDSGNLGLLDQACALRWVKRNIAAFGGNPDNVTIFGESAGGASVSLLPMIKEASGTFQRMIAESGSVALTYSKEECQPLTHKLLELTGAKNMNDLISLSEKDITELNKKLAGQFNFPERDGVVIPTDLYAAYDEGAAKDISLLIGTNADEMHFWISLMGGMTGYKIASNVLLESNMAEMSDADKMNVEHFMHKQPEGGSSVWDKTEFYNDLFFRAPALYQASAHSRHGGKTYVYQFKHPSSIENVGACHGVELAYVFNNLNETAFTGPDPSKEVARNIQEMWVNFAKTGNPSIPGYEWPEYVSPTYSTMLIDETPKVENNYLGARAKDIMPLLKYGFNGNMARVSFAVPYVYKWTVIIVISLIVIVTIVVVMVRRRRRRGK